MELRRQIEALIQCLAQLETPIHDDGSEEETYKNPFQTYCS